MMTNLNLFLHFHIVVSCPTLMFHFQLRYPDGCLASKYDQSFPIRGLYYDKLKGCLLKLDFFGSIEPDGCYFGRRKVWKFTYPISQKLP